MEALVHVGEGIFVYALVPKNWMRGQIELIGTTTPLWDFSAAMAYRSSEISGFVPACCVEWVPYMNDLSHRNVAQRTPALRRNHMGAQLLALTLDRSTASWRAAAGDIDIDAWICCIPAWFWMFQIKGTDQAAPIGVFTSWVLDDQQ